MRTLLWVLLTVLLSYGFAWADTLDSSAEIENLKERIRALEAKAGVGAEGEQPLALLALEYLDGRPDQGGDQQTLTAQLAFEF